MLQLFQYLKKKNRTDDGLNDYLYYSMLIWIRSKENYILYLSFIGADKAECCFFFSFISLNKVNRSQVLSVVFFPL